MINRDRALGHEHCIFARVDRITEAEALVLVYAEHGLRVESVSSNRTQRQIQETERRLGIGELDGIICVDMFGEGYDFPRFKIAVLHSAHTSLVPTLQFIGRFARTNDHRTGDATFVAIPNDVNSQGHELYREGVDWDVLLSEVADNRQQLAIRESETLRSFRQTGVPSADYDSVNPGLIRLPQHIAAYHVRTAPDFSSSPDDIGSLVTVAAWQSDEEEAIVIAAKFLRAPSWYLDDHLLDSAHQCFILRYFADSGFVFITATDRSERNYSDLLEFYFDGEATPLSLEQVRKILNGMTEQEFFSIGMRNVSPSAMAESYRIMAGSAADRGVRESDASNFAQGHFMGRGLVNGEKEVIGASSKGRIWSVGKMSIMETLNWMRALHDRINSQIVAIGKSGLDLLGFGETIQTIPLGTCMADWPRTAYRDNPNVHIISAGQRYYSCILDLEIANITVSPDARSLQMRIGEAGHFQQITHCPFRTPRYVAADNGPRVMVLSRDGHTISIEEWLEEYSLRFFTRDLESFEGTTLQKRAAHFEIRAECLLVHDWHGCDTLVEFDSDDANRPTVQKFLQDHLLQDDQLSFLIYDHRSGEAADFIAAKMRADGKLELSLYHCKGAGGDPSGERLDDVTELACQTIKSARFQKKNEIYKHIERRTEPRAGRGHSSFLKGTRAEALELIRGQDPINLELAVYAVQPGLAASRLAEHIKRIMGAANDSLAADRVSLRWLISD